VSVVLMNAFYAKRAVTISKMIVSRLVMNVSVPEFAYSALLTILKLFLRIIVEVEMMGFEIVMLVFEAQMVVIVLEIIASGRNSVIMAIGDDLLRLTDSLHIVHIASHRVLLIAKRDWY